MVKRIIGDEDEDILTVLKRRVKATTFCESVCFSGPVHCPGVNSFFVILEKIAQSMRVNCFASSSGDVVLKIRFVMLVIVPYLLFNVNGFVLLSLYGSS